MKLNIKSSQLFSSIVMLLVSACGLNNNELQSFNFNGTIGIKNFREYESFLAGTTGVTLPQASIDKLQPRLSQRGRVMEANPVSFMAMTMMAGQFCQTFVTSLSQTSGAQRRILKTADLTSAGAHASFRSDGELQATTVGELVRLLLQREPSDEEEAILYAAIDETLATQGNGTAADLRALITILCTIVASSADGMRV